MTIFMAFGSWSATPNEKDPFQGLYIIPVQHGLDAIEVVTISEASNLDNLINLLKNGIEYQPHSHRVMFAILCIQRTVHGHSVQHPRTQHG